MSQTNALSDVTKTYLTRYYAILDEMIRGMTTAELTNSIGHNFIVQMIPHHQAAIEMCENLLQYTTLVPLQRIASGIITAQTQSIADMRSVLSACSLPENTQEELALYARRFQEITRTMFSRMGGACSGNRLNVDFMREMIPHHEGAIRMSRNALRFPICESLTPILDAIISSQTKGVEEMTALLRCMGC